MIVPNADWKSAYQLDQGWGMAIRVLSVERNEAQGATDESCARLMVHQSVHPARLMVGTWEECQAELEHLCRLSGWRPIGGSDG